MTERDPIVWTPRSRNAVSSLARAWRVLAVLMFGIGSLCLLATAVGIYVVTDLRPADFPAGVAAVAALGTISVFVIGVSLVLASAAGNMRRAADDRPDMFNLHVTAGLADIRRYWFWATASLGGLAAAGGATAVWMSMA